MQSADHKHYNQPMSGAALPRLRALAAAQTARLLNVSDLASPFQLSRPTIRDYVTLLERVFLLESLPPWHTKKAAFAS